MVKSNKNKSTTKSTLSHTERLQEVECSKSIDCTECTEKVNRYIIIGYMPYCHDCINKYCLLKCPTNVCDNIISLNGYMEYDVYDYTCTLCDTVFCNECIIKENNTIVCFECYYDNTN